MITTIVYQKGFVSDGFLGMQALSDFSYHYRGGEQVLCDLQGGFYNRDGENQVYPKMLTRKK